MHHHLVCHLKSHQAHKFFQSIYPYFTASTHPNPIYDQKVSPHLIAVFSTNLTQISYFSTGYFSDFDLVKHAEDQYDKLLWDLTMDFDPDKPIQHFHKPVGETQCVDKGIV